MAAMDTDEPPSLAQALQAVQRLFPEAQDARRWAEERGYDWEPDDSLLTQFLQGEANCETLRLAKEHQKGAQERATVHARANALAAELGCTETLATEDALTFCEKVVEEKGAATLTANPTPRSADELKKLELIHAALKSDFELRRKMMLTRCDVTMQSFLWGDAAEGQEQAIVDSVYADRAALSVAPPAYSAQDALATSQRRLDAMEDALATPLQTKDQPSAMKTVLIDCPIPSRGGNIRDKRPSSKDIMPSWKKREEGGRGRGRGRGRGKGGRGGGRGGGKGGGKKKKHKKSGAVPPGSNG